MGNALMTRASASIKEYSKKETAEILSFVSGNVEEINKLSAKILVAQNAAEQARSKVADAKNAAEEAKKKVHDRSTVHWYDGKAKAINAVQKDVQGLAENQVVMADSQIALAEVQQRAAEAQELTFDLQKKLAGTTAMMIQFSVANIATSRLIVRELEARLNGASKEKLSDLARKELEAVICQIKMQQDVMSRQDQLTDTVREIDGRVAKQLEADAIRDEAIETQIKKGTQRDLQILEHERGLKSHQRTLVAHQQKSAEQEKLIAQEVIKNKEQDIRLDGFDEHNAQQDSLIAASAAKNDEQDARLARIDEHNLQQDLMIAEIVAKNEKRDSKLIAMDATNTKQDKLIQEQMAVVENLRLQIEALKSKNNNKAFLYITAVIAAATLVLSILHFFI